MSRPVAGMGRLLVALLACSLVALVSAQGPLYTYYQVTGTSSGITSPTTLGVNSGHNVDPAWTMWIKRMGANGIRIFGLQGMSSPLSTFVTNTPATFGADLNNVLLTNQASYNAAVAQLRSYNGRTPYAYNWPNPVRWLGMELQMNGSLPGATGTSIELAVAQAQAAGIEPLLVFYLPCAQFKFTSLDPTTAAYWQERWELYQHQYIAAQWAWAHGVRKIEFYNEPDLQACVTNATYLDFLTVQATAINNAFADYNGDVAAGTLSCPVASGCPFNPIITAAGFASATYSGTNKAGPTMYSSGVPGAVASDFFPYFASMTVLNEHLNFPPYLNTYSPTTQNVHMISQHSYGKTDYYLRALGQAIVAGIASNRTQPVPASLPTIPYAVTEVSAHTTGNFDAFTSNYDTPYEASRLGAQIMGQALSGWDTYIFKFSAAEYSASSSSNVNCVPNTTLPNTAAMCGVQKTGIHWGELNYPPYNIGDSTLAAEAAGLVFRAANGQKVVENLNGGVYGPNVYATLTGSSKYPSYAVPVAGVFSDAERRIFMIENDAYNPTDGGTCGASPCSSIVPYTTNVTLNVAAWNLPVGTSLVHNVVAAGYSAEVYTWPLQVPASGNVTFTVPPYSISTITAPAVPQTEAFVVTTGDATIFAGANQLTNYGAATGLTVSTSTTANHDTTAVSLISFSLGTTNPLTVLTAILELTVVTAPANDMLMTIVGCNTTDATSLAWNEGTIAWDTAAFAVTVPSGVIASPVNNFVRLDNGNVVAGHVTVAAGTPAGTVKRIEVTEYVRSAGASGSLTFVLARRMRRGFISGNAGGSIPADDLSGGASVVFSSRSGASPPKLRVHTGGTPYSQNLLFGVSYKSGGVTGRRRRLAQQAPAGVDPVVSGHDTTTAPSIASAISGTFPEATVAQPAVAGYSMRAFMAVGPLTPAQFALSQQRALEHALASTCGISRSHISLAAVQTSASYPNAVVVPISVSSFNNSAPDLGLALAEGCVDKLEAFQGLMTPSNSNSHFSSEFAKAGFPGLTFTTVSLDISRLWAVAVASDASATNGTTLEEWKANLDNSLATGVVQQSLSQSGVAGSVTRPGKFSAEGCVVASANAAMPPAVTPAPVPTSPTPTPAPAPTPVVLGGGAGAGAGCGSCPYQHKHVIAAAVVGSIGGVILGAIIFGVAWFFTRPKEAAVKRTEENRYGGQVPVSSAAGAEGKA